MRVNVSPTMMANLRFAYSPLLELTISYRVLRGNWQRAIYWRWLEEATAAIHDLDLPYMDALITGGASYGNINTIPKGYIPDFLTPTPLVPITDIEDEFDRLCQMDIDLVREGLQMAIEYFGSILDPVRFCVIFWHIHARAWRDYYMNCANIGSVHWRITGSA
jgi:hypothetical protein